MKNKLLISLIIFILLVVLKYSLSNYELTYKVDNYNIKTIFKSNRIYYEIDNKYNFDIYTKSRKKNVITKIDKINIEGYECIIPFIKNIKTYPLCNDIKNNINIDFNLINSEELSKYQLNNIVYDKPNKDFVYYTNVDDNTYVSLWTYKGYILMNSKGYKNINIFEKDRYDNDLSHQIGNKIYMPNYDMEHEFNELVVFNIKDGKTEKISLTAKIDYDSYVVGNIKKKLYLYDNKKNILYEINIKNGKTSIVGSNEKGFVKYINGKSIPCSKNEYKVDRITIDNKNTSYYQYSFDKGTNKTIIENNSIVTKILKEDVDVIYENNDKLYYKYKDSFYSYSPFKGSAKIFYDYELSFNNSKSVFVYID
jgi:hypothetical protein